MNFKKLASGPALWLILAVVILWFAAASFSTAGVQRIDTSQGLALIEAPNPRAEALAIALALRKAAGDGQRAALITPDQTLVRRVTAALDRAVARANEAVSRAESIRAYVVLKGDFTVANGYLTPSLKVKRSLVLDDFADKIEEIYSGAPATTG